MYRSMNLPAVRSQLAVSSAEWAGSAAEANLTGRRQATHKYKKTAGRRLLAVLFLMYGAVLYLRELTALLIRDTLRLALFLW